MNGVNAASRRLLAIHNHTSSIPEKAEGIVVVLPKGGEITASTTTDANGASIQLQLNKTPILNYYAFSKISLAFEISPVGTKYEGVTEHIPKTNVLELSPPDNQAETTKELTIPDAWAAIYALFTLYRLQEHIPIQFGAIANAVELAEYLIISGLGRLYQGSKKEDVANSVIFLSRAAFWQGAGTTGYHDRGWLLATAPVFPSVPSFTRSEMVIASHPLRPQKPRAGDVLYRRYCASVGQTLEFIAFDIDGPAGREGELSQHMAAFHRWHNDERVNSAWGEQGSLEMHREYIQGLLTNPGVMPCMMSWDGELMGYVEYVWVKENHVAQYYPSDVIVGDWERGIHVLVGEDKFLGNGRGGSR